MCDLSIFMKLSKKTKICNYIYIIGIVLIGLGRYFAEYFDSTYLSFLIFIFMDALWVSQVRRRIEHPKERKYLCWAGILCALFFFLKTSKYVFIESNTTLSRLFWYMYYIPQTFTILMIYMASLYVGKPVSYKPKKRYRILFVIASVICLLILTNDYHELAFDFVGDWNDEYNYGIVYYLSVLWVIVMMTMTFLTIFKRSITSDNVQKIWIPFVPVLVLLIYLIWFIFDRHNIFTTIYKTTDIICVTYLAFLELMIQSRLLINNDNFASLWINSTLNGGIYNENLELAYKTKNGKDITVAQLLNSEEKDVFLDGGDTLLRSKQLLKGHAYWCKDISAINKINDELNNMIDLLEEENSIIESANILNKKKQNLDKRKALYDYISCDVRNELEIISDLISESDDFDNRLKLSCIYMAYVKRRSNLLLISQNNETISNVELDLSIGESLDYLELYGFICNYKAHGSMSIENDVLLEMYYVFEKVVEEILPNTCALMVDCFYDEKMVRMHIEVSNIEPFKLHTWLKVDMKQEEDTLYIDVYRRLS